MGASWADRKSKNHTFKMRFSVIYVAISQLDCNKQWKVDFIQPPAQWWDQEVPKHFGKPNLHYTHTHTHTQRSWSLVVCWQSDPLQLSESQWNHYMWEVCLVNWWDTLKAAMPAASSGQQNGPNSSLIQCLTTHRTTNASKVEGMGLQCFASTAIFT